MGLSNWDISCRVYRWERWPEDKRECWAFINYDEIRPAARVHLLDPQDYGYVDSTLDPPSLVENICHELAHLYYPKFSASATDEDSPEYEECERACNLIAKLASKLICPY